MAAKRANTAIRFDQSVMDGLHAAAADHGVAVNWLVNKACVDFLDRLLPRRRCRVDPACSRLLQIFGLIAPASGFGDPAAA